MFATARIAAAVLAALCLATSAQAESQYSGRSDAAYAQAYRELSDALDRIEVLNAESRDRSVRRRIRALIGATRLRARLALRAEWRAARERDELWHGGSEFEIGAEAFSRLLESVRRAPFPNDRVLLVESASREQLFRVEQVRALVELGTFAEPKLQIAVLLYPRVLDPENWYRVYELFPFSAEREQLRERVRALQARE